MLDGFAKAHKKPSLISLQEEILSRAGPVIER